MKKRNRAVIVTGFVGLKGTAILAKTYKEKIDKHYPVYLSRNAENIADSVEKDAAEALRVIQEHLEHCENEAAKNVKAGEPVDEALVVEIADGGFLTAMWTLAKQAGQGFTLDLRKVPVKQETIEICELTEVNPYHLCSYGSVAAIVTDGLLLQEKLGGLGIPSVIIGYTNSSKAHILMNDGTESHLNRPEPDELKRLGIN